MKQIIYSLSITLILFLTACSSKPKKEGQITLKNGEDKEVLVNYQITNYDEFITQINNKEDFQTIIDKASSEAHMTCKFMPTYEPKQISFIISNDTVTTFLTFNAKNAFGVPGSNISFSKFKKTTFIESF